MITRERLNEILKDLNLKEYCIVGGFALPDVQKDKDADIVLSPKESLRLIEFLDKLDLNKYVKRGKFLYSFYLKTGEHIDFIVSQDDKHYEFLCKVMSPSPKERLPSRRNNLLKIIAYMKGYSFDWMDGLYWLEPLTEFETRIIKINKHWKKLPKTYFKYWFVSRDLDYIANTLLNATWSQIESYEDLLNIALKDPDLKDLPEVLQSIKI